MQFRPKPHLRQIAAIRQIAATLQGAAIRQIAAILQGAAIRQTGADRQVAVIRLIAGPRPRVTPFPSHNVGTASWLGRAAHRHELGCNTFARSFACLEPAQWCECMTGAVQVCWGTCMTPSLTAMGFTIHIRGTQSPLIYAQPSGLTSAWHLKYTMTLQSPPAQAYKHIYNIIVSAVLNVHPLLK